MTSLRRLHALENPTYHRSTLQADLKRDLWKYGLYYTLRAEIVDSTSAKQL